MVGVLNVNDHDVVGKQQNLVGMQLACVLVRERLGWHELGVAHKLGHVGARTRERVEDVNPLAAQSATEFPLKRSIGGMEHVVHDLDGCINDAELLARAGKGLSEEVVVEVLDEGLTVGIGTAEGGATADAAVELVEATLVVNGEVADTVSLEGVEEILNGDRDRVRLREGVVTEESIEDRQRHHVLGDHLDSSPFGNARIERIAQRSQERVHSLASHRVPSDSTFDLLDVSLGDAAHVLGPAGPVDLAAALLDSLGVNGTLEISHTEVEGERRLAIRAPTMSAARLLGIGPPRLATNAKTLILLADLTHGEAVNVSVNALIVTSQRLQNTPHDVKGIRLVKCLLRCQLRGNSYG